MAAGKRSSRAAVNVLGVSSYGVHAWPVLGVHRGLVQTGFVESSATEFRFRIAPDDPGYALLWLYGAGDVVHY